MKCNDYRVAQAIDDMKDRELDKYLTDRDKEEDDEDIDDGPDPDRKYDEKRDN